MLRCGAPFFCAGPVRYVNTCVHAKFEANLCTWAPSRTVDVSRFRVGRRAATAGGGRAVAARPPPLAGGDRRRPPPVAAAATASTRRRAPAVAARGGGGRRLGRGRSPPRRPPLRSPPLAGGDRCGRRCGRRLLHAVAAAAAASPRRRPRGGRTAAASSRFVRQERALASHEKNARAMTGRAGPDLPSVKSAVTKLVKCYTMTSVDALNPPTLKRYDLMVRHLVLSVCATQCPRARDRCWPPCAALAVLPGRRPVQAGQRGGHERPRRHPQ